MSPLPTINFGPSHNGLFSPDEISRLMDSEYRRALRYEYPLALLLIEIDRLESLHDLYGVDSRNRIARAVTSMLRSSTRESDALGILVDQRLLVLVPHTGREAMLVIARRLLTGCRELEFRGDGRVLRASLSIGCATRGDEGDLTELCERAEAALESAVEAGGDRVAEYGHQPARSTSRPRGFAAVPPPAVPRPRPAPASARPTPLPGAHELAGDTLEEKVRGLLAIATGSASLGPLEDEVVQILRRTVDETRRSGTTREEVRAEIARQEERVQELRRMLDASEEELARMIQEKSVDPGLASVYRTVQGIEPSAKDYARKKELLSVLYKANVELLAELEDAAGEGSK